MRGTPHLPLRSPCRRLAAWVRGRGQAARRGGRRLDGGARLPWKPPPRAVPAARCGRRLPSPPTPPPPAWPEGRALRLLWTRFVSPVRRGQARKIKPKWSRRGGERGPLPRAGPQCGCRLEAWTPAASPSRKSWRGRGGPWGPGGGGGLCAKRELQFKVKVREAQAHCGEKASRQNVLNSDL